LIFFITTQGAFSRFSLNSKGLAIRSSLDQRGVLGGRRQTSIRRLQAEKFRLSLKDKRQLIELPQKMVEFLLRKHTIRSGLTLSDSLIF
jgi:hypothetical protein